MASHSPDATSPAPPGRFSDFVRDMARFAGLRLVWMGAVVLAAAAAEGVGILLLLPLLGSLGVESSGSLVEPLRRIMPADLRLEEMLAVYVAVVVVAACVVASRGVLVSRLRNDYTDDLRTRLHTAVLSAQWRTVAGHRPVDLAHILTAEVARTGEGIMFLLRLTGWAIEIPVLIGVAMALSPAMTGLVLLFAAGIAMAGRPLDRLTHDAGRRIGPSGRRVLAAISDDIGSLATIKCYGAEGRRAAQFAAAQRSNREHRVALEQAGALARVVVLSGGAAAVALAVWVAIRVLGMAVADTAVLVVAMARVLPLAARVHDSWRIVLRALPAHATAAALLEELTVAADRQTSAAPPLMTGGDIRFRNVVVQYRPGAPPALGSVTLTIPAGRHIAVVGPSGAGKSTLALTLAGLLAPDAGEIEVGGTVLDDSARVAWRRRTALVPQEPVLFNESIAANLRLAAPDGSDAALLECLDAADAGFVHALPLGLETPVGDRGTSLSGGERQRIALARALLARPVLLILDEPTAALDPAGESRVIATLRHRRPGTTVVTVSHRPALARAADMVVVMEAGTCVGQGAWEALDPAIRRRVELLGL